MVLVGALNVGSMATVWAGDITPAARRTIAHIPAADTLLDKGAELGRFNMGSTVIVLFQPGHARWRPALAPGTAVRVGECLEPSVRQVSDWRPTATLAALHRRAAMLARVRTFFAERGVLEVETPALSAGGVTDPQIESLVSRLAGYAGRALFDDLPRVRHEATAGRGERRHLSAL